MANYNVPNSPKIYEVDLSGFLGVDFSSSITDIDKRRSPQGKNFINKDGTIEKRNGYKILAYLGLKANINGIWNVDTVSGEFFIVHCGTKLFEMKTNFSEYTEILTGLDNTKSKGVIINSKLLILDGKRAIIYDLLEQNNRAHYLDELGYIPTTYIARSPSGLASQAYEKVNLIQDSRINQFQSTETDTVYQLAETNLTAVEKVEVLNQQGVWITKIENTDYAVNLISGQVTFSTAIGNPPVDGRDNVRIKYKITSASNKSQVNKCTLMKIYGYAGANNRVFMTGNPDYPNIVMWSYANNLTYIPVENVIKTGLEIVPINGLIKLLNGKLGILKDNSDTDDTLFQLGYAMYNGEEVFPLEGSIKGEGNIGKYADDTLIDEPLILTRNGIFAINTATLAEEKHLYHRSYYIDSKLKQETGLENAVGISNDGKYYLAINDHVYIADSRFKTNSKNAKYSNYQYEWFYWTDLPVKVWFVWNDELYFGDKSGNICKFRTDNDENRFLDNESPVVAEWNSCILDLNKPAHKKNVKRIAIQSNPTNSKLEVGYRLKSGTKEILQKEYINSTYPKTTVIRKKAKKLAFFSLYIENDEASNMNFNSVSVLYTIGSFYKGD